MKAATKKRVYYALYGSLKNPGLLRKITSHDPVSMEPGFIRGTLFKVTDYTEPHNVFTYPLLIPSESSPVVTAILVTYQMTAQEISDQHQRLTVFEGPLFTLSMVKFTSFLDGKTTNAFVYRCIQRLSVAQRGRMQKMTLSGGVYHWMT